MIDGVNECVRKRFEQNQGLMETPFVAVVEEVCAGLILTKIAFLPHPPWI